MRDQECVSHAEQNKQLLQSVQAFEHAWEQCSAENNNLKEQLALFEAEMEQTNHESAKLMGHANHKQKVQYHVKVKEENVELKKQVCDLRQQLAPYEMGQRGSSLMEALKEMGGGGNGGEMSVCNQSVCSTRGMEPRTPNPKGEKGCRTPRQTRPSSAGPKSARKGQDCLEADNCPRCDIQQRATERTIVDFQHFVAMIERAAFAGDVGASSADPNAVLERLRVAGGIQAGAAGAP